MMRGDTWAKGAGVICQHAWRRITERLTPAEQQVFFARMKVVEQIAPECGHDFGIQLMTLDGQRNAVGSNDTNGDSVWAIIRRGVIKTVMLRRSSQPSTAEALRVDRVVLL